MYEFDVDKLPRILEELEKEQAIWEERAYAAYRLAQIFESHCNDVERRKQALILVNNRLIQAIDVYEGQ